MPWGKTSHLFNFIKFSACLLETEPFDQKMSNQDLDSTNSRRHRAMYKIGKFDNLLADIMNCDFVNITRTDRNRTFSSNINKCERFSLHCKSIIA